MSKAYLLSLGLVAVLPGFTFAATQLTVKAVNPLPLARASQTLELTADQLAPLGRELARVRVRDGSGRELLCQAIDSDGNYEHDTVIFQADFAANEEKTFTAVLGERWVYTPDQFRAYGRFIRERFDDFTWENDRIAHRTYGQALETWQNEPLTSSTIDIWSKRTPKMVINEWYMADDYHADHGEGADFYSAGLSRGCGGNGLWAADQLWVSRNFRQSRVLANGPIRVLFELTYEPFNVNGTSVAEVKRISLDAGHHLDRFESRYAPYTRPGQPVTLTMAAGLKKVAGEEREHNADRGWLAKWERMEKNAGNQGLALVVNPGDFQSLAEDRLNWLMVAKVSPENAGVYWAGFCWDKGGQFTSADAWEKHVDEFSQGLRSPIQLTVSSQ